MKKVYVLLILSLFSFFIFAEDCSKKIFSKWFDKASPAYEFNIRNPLFADVFYVEKPNLLKNKIIKVTKEMYRMDSEGRKSYSDSYIRDVTYQYYFFNAESRITDYYLIDISDSDFLLYKNHEMYNFSESIFSLTLDDYVNELYLKLENPINSIKDGIEIDLKEDCSISRNYSYYNVLKFYKNHKIEENNISDTYKICYDYVFDNDTIQKECYTLDNNKKSVSINETYNRCCLLFRSKKNVPSGEAIYRYKMDDTGNGTYEYKKEENPEIYKTVSKVKRKFNKIGFLEYEEKTPFEGTVGDYSYYKAEVLDRPDDLFNKHFK